MPSQYWFQILKIRQTRMGCASSSQRWEQGKPPIQQIQTSDTAEDTAKMMKDLLIVLLRQDQKEGGDEAKNVRRLLLLECAKLRLKGIYDSK